MRYAKIVYNNLERTNYSKNMSLQQTINEDVKQAMRAKEADKLSVLRMLNASLKNKMISLRDGESVALTDEQIQEVIASEVKKRRDSAAEYRNAGRSELAEKEEMEVGVLEVYLPAQLSDEKLEAGVRAVVEAAEKKEFGLLMKEVMAKFKGQADGRRVGEAIKKILG